jgi:DNA-binding response OmpR family regulator
MLAGSTKKRVRGPQDESLKNSQILIIHGADSRLNDVIKTLKRSFNNVLCVTSFAEIPKQDFDIIFVEYSVSDLGSILAYKNLVQIENKEVHLGLVPAIFISDTKSYDHRLNAFEIGAADFMTRPFEAEDVLDKCLVHIKNRRRFAEDQSIHIGNLSLYPALQKVTIAGEAVSLTQLEYKILHFLLSTPRQVVTRTEIYENIWGPSLSSSGRLDTQLYNLKKKIAKFNGKIKSVNKVGMRILTAESTFSLESKKVDPQLSLEEPHP